MRLRYLGILLTLATLSGCGGGPPRRPTPPSHDESLKRERFQILGAEDTWSEPLPILRELESMGGVKEAFVHEETGRYVVVYDPRRTHRDAISQKVAQIGQDLGQTYEALFDDR